MPEVLTPPSPTAERVDAERTIAFDEAVKNRDEKKLLTIAADSTGTPLSGVATSTAIKIGEGKQQFAQLIDPLEKKGGVATPEGRKEAVNIWKSTIDNPQWGTALIKYILGDKEGAAKQITGGDVKETIVYDVDGAQLIKRVNALGETLEVKDMKTNKLVLPEEYAKRKIGFSSLAETYAGQIDIIDTKARAEALVKNQTINNAWIAKFPVLKEQFVEIENNLMEFQNRKGDIPAELFARINRFNTQAQGTAASQSETKSILKQISENAASRKGEQISKALTSKLGLEGVWTLDGKGGITNEKGNTENIGELQQKNDAATISNQRSEDFKSIKADILKSEQLKGASGDLQGKLLRSLELADNIAKTTSELSKVGVPTFLSLPAAFNIENKLSQGRAQALQGQFSAEAMDEFKEFYKQAIKNYTGSQRPEPNQLESEFVKTPEYKALQSKYGAKIKDVMNEARFERPSAPAAPSKAAAKPPVQIPKGYKKVGKTPDGKDVYRTPEGKQVVEE
jgi:hypothetical protein